jgi:3-oxoacyl-[acyl-carrier protein] reductase
MNHVDKSFPRTAIVTGASRGIGRAIAIRLAADGCSVVVNYAGNASAAQGTVDTVRAAGGTALAYRADVSSSADVTRLYAFAQDAFGGTDVVVSNAGIMPIAQIVDGSIEDFDNVIATNLRATFLMMAGARKNLRDGGSFIAMSSSVIAKSFPGYGPYIASKAGVEGLVHVFANELRGRGITVNAVAPGPVGTELFLKGKTDEQIAQLAKLAPLQRIGEVDDIARAVSFLAGPDGRWVNSQVLRVNGGYA